MHVYETPGSVSLQIRLPSGRVVVTTVDEPRSSVELVPLGRRGHDVLDEIEVSARERPGGHVITIEQKDRFRFGPIQISWGSDVEVRITCPHGADLELSSGSTDLKVEGDLGAVNVKTASGDIELGRVEKRLQVKTASGDIAVRDVEADASLTTVSGDIDVDRLAGSLVGRAVSGDAHLGTVEGPVTLSTTSGDALFDVVEAGEVRVQSISGDVRIGVGRGTRVWVDATSVSGDLTSELGLEGEPAEAPAEAGAVVPVHVKTVSGDVALVRAAERARS